MSRMYSTEPWRLANLMFVELDLTIMTILMTSNGYTASVATNEAVAPNNPWKCTLYSSTINKYEWIELL